MTDANWRSDEFARRLRTARAYHDISAPDLAKRIGVSRMTDGHGDLDNDAYRAGYQDASAEIDSLRAQLAEARRIIKVLADIDSSSLVEPGSDDDRYTLYLSKPGQAHEIHGDDLRRARAFLNKEKADV